MQQTCFPLSSFHFPSPFLSDHSDPLKRFSNLINCLSSVLGSFCACPSSHLSSSSPNKTDHKQQTSFIPRFILQPWSCDTAALYYIVPASAERSMPRHNQYFTVASLGEDLIVIFIQTQATEKAPILKVYSSLFGHHKSHFCI